MPNPLETLRSPSPVFGSPQADPEAKGRRKRARWGVRHWHRRLMAHALRKSLQFARNGEHAKAIPLLRRLSKAVPKLSRVHLQLASACELAAGDPMLARRAVETAASGSRATAGVLSRAALFELQWGNTKEALEILRLAQERFPSSWRVWETLGQWHLETGDAQQAIHCFERQMEFAASRKIWLQAMSNVARCHEESGNENEAVSIYRKIIDAAPQSALAYWSLLRADESLADASELAQTIRELLRSNTINEEARLHFHYALGTVYDRGRRPAEAFAHFHLANEIRAKKFAPVNVEKLREEVETRMKLFDRERIAKLAEYGSRDHCPICIVGMPRSGTTLVEQIISSHSSVCALGERIDVWRLTRALRWELRSNQSYPQCVHALAPSAVGRLARAMAEKRAQAAAGSPRVTTKSPADFWDLGLIQILFPRAKIIHCRRHPIDTCLSCYMQDFSDVPFATSLTHLSEVYRLYERVMEHWRSVLPASSFCEISYEDLLNRPAETVRALCAFCGLEFEESCLQFYRNPRRVDTASLWQVRRPLYNSSVGRWQAYREFLGPLLALENPAGADGKRDGQHAVVMTS